MIKAEVSNCNNVNSATILLKENILNIYYAMNGTGKSTVAKAIELSTTDDDLLSLKPFGSSITPTCVLSPANKKVLLFNEDFVNDFVFQESDLIKNAFEVFIKSPEYERR